MHCAFSLDFTAQVNKPGSKTEQKMACKPIKLTRRGLFKGTF
ncbi:hypothetical protein SOHN41_02900 [Shewanella sp. HN-41]|nr:hypothetical protein SOHN41_02900 [Shewanella sp. HN-41]